MAIRYKFQTSLGEVTRRMQIPETTEETLHDNPKTYQESDIEWLHNTEKQNIEREVERLQAQENARAEREGDDAREVKLIKVWTEPVK